MVSSLDVANDVLGMLLHDNNSDLSVPVTIDCSIRPAYIGNLFW